MKCFICNSDLPEVQFSETHGDIEPCPTCLFVIADTVGAGVDKPSADEDALPDEPDFYNQPNVGYRDELL
jgi:hypothetical protein